MNKREEILTLANKAVNGERQETYGSPEDSFDRIAHLWSAYLRTALTRLDVAKMMILFKLARTGERAYLDNWIDIAGYAACAGEIEDGSYNPEYHQKSIDKALEEVKKSLGKEVRKGGMTSEDWKSLEKIKEYDREHAEAMRSAYNG